MAIISASPEIMVGTLRPSARFAPRPELPANPVRPIGVDQGVCRDPEAVLSPGSPAGLRLVATLLGLFVLTLALSGLVARAASTVAAAGEAPAQRSLPVESAAYPAWTVGPGDSLWSIARATAPGADPRATVQVLRTLNGLSPQHVLQVGEVLQLPTR
jgi:hypothetical protein